MTSEKEVCVTSFCINCGVAVRYECALDDPRLNQEPCTCCLLLLQKIAESEIAEDFIHEANAAVPEMLPAGVKRAKRTSVKIAIDDARKARRLAVAALKERRAKVHSKLGRLTKSQ